MGIGCASGPPGSRVSRRSRVWNSTGGPYDENRKRCAAAARSWSRHGRRHVRGHDQRLGSLRRKLWRWLLDRNVVFVLQRRRSKRLHHLLGQRRSGVLRPFRLSLVVPVLLGILNGRRASRRDRRAESPACPTIRALNSSGSTQWFGAFDDQHLNWAAGALEPQSQLLVEGDKNGRTAVASGS